MDTPDILEAAADRIDAVGWWDGTSSDNTDPDRPTCAALAIRWAVGDDAQNLFCDPATQIARAALISFLGLSTSDSPVGAIARWNDAQPDAFAVTNALRKCAEQLR
jgi:hypothetical protein